MALVIMLAVTLSTICVYLVWKYRQFSTSMDHLPGPKGIPILGNAHQFNDYSVFHKEFFNKSKQYGSVFKVKLVHNRAVVLSGFHTLREFLIQKGQQTSARFSIFRTRFATKDTGILFQFKADDIWKSLRKLSQQHLKQFGEGMTRLEYLISDIAEDMFGEFSKSGGVPLDPKDVILDSAVQNIAFIITGDRYEWDDPLVQQMKQYEPLFMNDVTGVPSLSVLLIDAFPPCRFLFRSSWEKVRRVMELEDAIWADIKARLQQKPDTEGLGRLLLLHTNILTVSSSDAKLTERDARQTCMSLLLAGTATTSQSFYAFINILAHNKDIQDKLFEEIHRAVGDRRVLLNDRADLPYTMATLLELLRYFTVVALGVPHAITDNDTIIQGYHLPKGAIVFTSLWELHNNPDFWGDPNVFRPERFLDTEGLLLPADHPKRKHLMPFGTGPRVCLGEAFAKARLFLWIAGLVQRFEVSPAEGNHTKLTEQNSYYYQSVLYSPPFKVQFTQRN